MNHPNREGWMEYLYGELTPGARAELETHLAGCPECAANVQAWRATIRGLDQWVLPKRARGVDWGWPLVKWAAAAALVLGLGFGLGRVSVARDVDKVRAAVLPVLRQQLRQELAADWQAALAGNAAGVTTDFRRQLRTGLDQFGAHQLAAANAQSQRWLADFVQSYNLTRAEDHQALLALFQEADQRRQADFASLRKDLETVAVVAEGRLDTAQQEIGRLAAYARTEATPVDMPRQVKSLRKTKGN